MLYSKNNTVKKILQSEWRSKCKTQFCDLIIPSCRLSYEKLVQSEWRSKCKTQFCDWASPNSSQSFQKIGFVADVDPFHDKKAWSGTIYKLCEAIQQAGYDVIWIPYRRTGFQHWLLKKYYKLLWGKKVLRDQNKAFYRLCAKTVDNALLNSCDFLFFAGHAQMAAYFEVKKPVIYYTDTTFELMLDYYWFGVPASIIRKGNEVERIGIHNSALNIRASQWAADSVIRFYGANPKSVRVIEMGANVADADISPVEPYVSGELRILFSGVEWERKGAETAILTVEELNKRGINARLIMVGIKKVPDAYKGIPYVDYVGFLDKNDRQQYERYIETVKQAHIFLLPTQAECAGIVFAEASAFGIPIFTYDTGGIPNYVINGVNGYRLPMSSSYVAFADSIVKTIQANELPVLSRGGLQLYKDRLNWNAWAQSFRKIMDETFACE